ncbi:MAG: hypothetical protein IIT56_13810, partial [Bacteroidales bacterium]|nr:hypothetical protein [Bacteroidales bacterium]
GENYWNFDNTYASIFFFVRDLPITNDGKAYAVSGYWTGELCNDEDECKFLQFMSYNGLAYAMIECGDGSCMVRLVRNVYD